MTPREHQQEQAAVFRRRRFAPPRRRQRLWSKLLKPFAAALAIVGIPAAATVWASSSPVLRVTEVTISGGDRVSSSVAREQLRVLEGRHILLLRLGDVQKALGEQAWLRGVEMSKRLPSRLEVRLLERRSVALLRTAEGIFFLDQRGEIIAPYEPAAGFGNDVFIVAGEDETESIREALAVASAWEGAAGSWAAGLSEIEVIDAFSFRIHASDLDFPVLVTRANLVAGLRALQDLLPRMNRAYPQLAVADLRFSGQIVFRPADGPPMEG